MALSQHPVSTLRAESASGGAGRLSTHPTQGAGDMKRIRLLGLALMAVFAFGVVVAAMAQAEEKEPAGLLFLAGEKAPVTIKGTIEKGAKLVSAGGTIEASGGTTEAECGTDAGEETHVTLCLNVKIDFTGVKDGFVPCNSETNSVKDPKETVLVDSATGADIHFISLENGAGKLIPGIVVILLKNVVLNCLGVKVEVKGSAVGSIEGASATADVTKVTLNFLSKAELEKIKCDKNDKLCQAILGTGNLGGALSAKIGEKFEPAEEIAKAKVESNKMVLIDF
jgi:hypothetical protein